MSRLAIQPGVHVQATFASKVDVKSESEVHVTREVDGGLQTIGLQLPAVVTCDLRLNEPRFATLPNVMKARKKKIEQVDPVADCMVDLAPSLKIISVAEPQARQAGSILNSVDELVDKLQNEAKVLD